MAYSSGDAADQVVKMSLEGIELVARLSGSGAKNLAAFLFAAMQGEKQTKGRARLEQMLRTDKELKVFSVNREQVERFTKLAKKYGVMYTVVHDKSDKDNMTDIIVRASDAPQVNRIIERLDLATVDVAKIEVELQEKVPPIRETSAEKTPEAFVDEIMKKPDKSKEEPTLQNPTIATEKTPPSANSFRHKNADVLEGKPVATGRGSIRAELAEIKSGEVGAKPKQQERGTGQTQAAKQPAKPKQKSRTKTKVTKEK